MRRALDAAQRQKRRDGRQKPLGESDERPRRQSANERLSRTQPRHDEAAVAPNTTPTSPTAETNHPANAGPA